jgi:glycerol-1-phosphatase
LLAILTAADGWLRFTDGVSRLGLTCRLGAWPARGTAGGMARVGGVTAPPRDGVADFDGLIVDLDGVIWTGSETVDGAAEAIAAVRANGTRVVFLTNEARRERSALAARLTGIGIPATEADVITSGSVAGLVVAALDGLARRRALVLGPAALQHEVQAAGFELVGHDEAATAEVVVVGAHEGFDYAELRAATRALRARGADGADGADDADGAAGRDGTVRLFATGRDAIFPGEDGPWPATGAILAAVEIAGGTHAQIVGKPERIMFETARAALPGCQRIGVIGDHLISDIAGARRAGLASILVLTGVTSRADLERADIQPDLVLESVAALRPSLTPSP